VIVAESEVIDVVIIKSAMLCLLEDLGGRECTVVMGYQVRAATLISQIII